jgi:hypothetical protein
MPTHPFRRLLSLAAVLSLAACSETTLNATVASLRFLSLPTSAVAGEPFIVEVELLNPSGERASDSRASVVIRLIGTATLSGETTVEASQGVATFEGLELTIAGTTIILEAEAATFTAQSAQFAVAPAAPSGEQSTATAPVTPLFPFGPSQLTFTFKDAFGNVLAQKAVSVTASQAGSTLTPSSGTTNASGVFSSEFLPSGEGNVTFTAVVDGSNITLGTTLPIVDPCPPAPMTIGTLVNGSVPAGNCAMNGFPAAAFRFSVGAPSGVGFDVETAFPGQLEVQTDPPGSNVQIDFGFLDAVMTEWLLPAGTYRLRLGSAGASGPFALQGVPSPGTSPNVVRALVVAGTYLGQEITEGDPDAYDDGTGADFYLVFSQRACTIRVETSAFTPYLDVFSAVGGIDPDFREIDDDLGPVAEVSLTACRTPSGAPLFIIANNFLPTARGAYTFTLTFTGGSSAAPLALQSASSALRSGAYATRPALTGLKRPTRR